MRERSKPYVVAVHSDNNQAELLVAITLIECGKGVKEAINKVMKQANFSLNRIEVEFLHNYQPVYNGKFGQNQSD